MEQEIQKLQERLAKAKEVFREMNAKDKEKDARIAELEAQLAEAVANANNNATEGEDAIADLTAQLRTMEERWRNADEFAIKYGSEVKMLNETIETMRFDLMKATGERDRIKLDYDKLNESFKTVTEENAKLKEITIEYKERFKMYEETNAEYKQSIDKLIESKKALESAVEYANSEKARLTSELDKADDYINKKEKQFESVQQTLNDKQAQIIELQNTIERLTSSNKILEDELAKTKHDKDVIKETVTKHVATIKKSMQGLNDGLGVEFDIFGN